MASSSYQEIVYPKQVDAVSEPFGESIALSGDGRYLAVGCPLRKLVYVYRRDPSYSSEEATMIGNLEGVRNPWILVNRINPSMSGEGALEIYADPQSFGASVAFLGTTSFVNTEGNNESAPLFLIVGDPDLPRNTTISPTGSTPVTNTATKGAVFVFKLSEKGHYKRYYINDTVPCLVFRNTLGVTADTDVKFGLSIETVTGYNSDQNIIFIGANNGTDRGNVLVFHAGTSGSPEIWGTSAPLVFSGNDSPANAIGKTLKYSNGKLFASSSLSAGGPVEFFDFDKWYSGGHQTKAYDFSVPSGSGGSFGDSIDVYFSGTNASSPVLIAISSPNDTVSSLSNAGRVFYYATTFSKFNFNSTSGSPLVNYDGQNGISFTTSTSILTSSHVIANGKFGSSVSFAIGSGNFCIIVGEPKIDASTNTFGTIHIFSINPSSFSLTGPTPIQSYTPYLQTISVTQDQGFGKLIKYSNRSLIVSAPKDNYSYSSPNVGAVFSLNLVGSEVGTHKQTVLPLYYTFSDNKHFGKSISISEDGLKLVVGAPGDGTSAVEPFAYCYFREKDTFKFRSIQNLSADTPNESKFSESLAMSRNGKILVIGSPFEGTPKQGRVYVYCWDSVNLQWDKVGFQQQTTGTSADDYGSVVCISTFGKYYAATSRTTKTVFVYSVTVNETVEPPTAIISRVGSAEGIPKTKLEGASDLFGASLSLPQVLIGGGETIFIGDPGYKVSGGVAIFNYTPTSSWTITKVITPSSSFVGSIPSIFSFGKNIYASVSGKTLGVSANGKAFIYNSIPSLGSEWSESVLTDVPSSSVYIDVNKSPSAFPDVNASVRVISGGASFPPPSVPPQTFNVHIYDSVSYNTSSNKYTFQRSVNKSDPTVIDGDTETFFGNSLDAGFPLNNLSNGYLAIGSPESSVLFDLNNKNYTDTGSVAICSNSLLPSRPVVKLTVDSQPVTPPVIDADQTDNTSFYTIIIIVGVLMLLFIVGIIISIIFYYRRVNFNMSAKKFRSRVMALPDV